MKPLLILLSALAVAGWARAADREDFRSELALAERNFCSQAARIGVADAFLANMAPECFLPGQFGLTRDEYAAKVKAARAKAGAGYKPGANPKFQLTWAPLKIEVSDDGTLGYTWGRYDAVERGNDGQAKTTTGVYLTIWRRQADGSWKFVYDGSPELPSDPAALQRFLARPDLPHQPPG